MVAATAKERDWLEFLGVDGSYDEKEESWWLWWVLENLAIRGEFLEMDGVSP